MSNTAVMDKPATSVKPAKGAKPKDPAELPAKVVEDVPAGDVKPAAAADSRYPAQDVRDSIAARLRAAHDAGWTRPRISDEVGVVGGSMGGSALWRTAKGNVQTHEVPYVTQVLDKIDAGELTLPEKATKNPAKLAERLTAAQSLLDQVKELAEAGNASKTAKEAREALAAIVEAVSAA